MKTFIGLSLLAIVLSAPHVFAQSESIGSFEYFKDLDEFTDEDRSTIMTADEDARGVLIWRCMADGLNVLLNVGGFMGGDRDDDIQVRYRFDANEPSGYQYWRLFPGQNEIAYMRMNNVDSFTIEALASTALVMEAIDPLDNERRRYRMTVSGLKQALGKLSCAEKFH